MTRDELNAENDLLVEAVVRLEADMQEMVAANRVLAGENKRLATRLAESEAVGVLVGQLTATVAAQNERIAALEKLLEETRRRGKRQAAPFSKGDPKPEPKTPGRKRGDGHGRHGHRMAPTGEPDRELHAGLPACCPHCAGDLVEDRVADQWQTDFVVVPVRTRFRVHVGHCTGCGGRVQGRHAEQSSDALGAAGAQIGPHAKALALWLHYGAGLSFGRCAAALAMLGVEVTRGALSQAAGSTGKDLVPTYDGLIEKVAGSSMVVMDETGWRVGGSPAWLWDAVTRDVTVYHVAQGEGARSFDAGCALVPADYDATIVRDGWGPYRQYVNAAAQTCTAHLIRRCDEMITDGPADAVATPRFVKDVLLQGLAARDLPDGERRVVADRLTGLIERLAECPQPNDGNRKLVKHLNNELDNLFTYLDDPTIDATNWRAEQGIRPAVVNRKTFGGNRTMRGARTQEVISSVLATAHQQGHDIIDLLVGLARAPAPGRLSPLTDFQHG